MASLGREGRKIEAPNIGAAPPVSATDFYAACSREGLLRRPPLRGPGGIETFTLGAQIAGPGFKKEQTMAFSFPEFMRVLRGDNFHYERMYRITGKGKSRLHDLVEYLKRGNRDPWDVARLMERIPHAAWIKYRNTKRYLVMEFGLVSAGAPVDSVEVRRELGWDISGYGRPSDKFVRPSTTGKGQRQDGRFYWSIEVVYTLQSDLGAAEFVPLTHYAPRRREKSEESNQLFGKLKSSNLQFGGWTNDQLKKVASAKDLKADGPRYFNVKRVMTSVFSPEICIHDDPGIDREGAVQNLIEVPKAYPIRFCAYFMMELYTLQPNVKLETLNQDDFTGRLQDIVPGSTTRYGCLLWKEHRHGRVQGEFIPRW